MATVQDVATRVLSSIFVNAENPIGIELAAVWVSDRLAEILGRTRFRAQRRLGTLTTNATISDGTMNAVAGAALIPIDAEADAAIVAAGGLSAVQGSYIRFDTVWYRVAGYVSGFLTISPAYTETTNSTASYEIVQRFHELDASARWLGRFVHMRRRRVLEQIPYEALDRLHPERQFSTGGFNIVAEATPASDGTKRVELYPYSEDAESVYYTYWPAPSTLALDDDIPAEIDPYILREGALIDAMRYRASQAASGARIDEAAFWRNESRAQETRWERYIMQATRADRGFDDVSFILNFLGPAGSEGPDITNAHDEVWARGRP